MYIQVLAIVNKLSIAWPPGIFAYVLDICDRFFTTDPGSHFVIAYLSYYLDIRGGCVVGDGVFIRYLTEITLPIILGGAFLGTWLLWTQVSKLCSSVRLDSRFVPGERKHREI